MYATINYLLMNSTVQIKAGASITAIQHAVLKTNTRLLTQGSLPETHLSCATSCTS